MAGFRKRAGKTKAFRSHKELVEVMLYLAQCIIIPQYDRTLKLTLIPTLRKRSILWTSRQVWLPGVQVGFEADFGEMSVSLAAWAALVSAWHKLLLLIRGCQIQPATHTEHTHTPNTHTESTGKRVSIKMWQRKQKHRYTARLDMAQTPTKSQQAI